MQTALPPILKGKIIGDLKEGYAVAAISVMRDVPVEVVRAIKTARQEVRLLLKRGGADPAVVYANFQDLLTQQECGL